MLHSSHFALNWRCCTAVHQACALAVVFENLWTSSFKCYVDHSHTMYSSGNIDVRNWVHLFESRCTSLTYDQKDCRNQKTNLIASIQVEIYICVVVQQSRRFSPHPKEIINRVFHYILWTANINFHILYMHIKLYFYTNLNFPSRCAVNSSSVIGSFKTLMPIPMYFTAMSIIFWRTSFEFVDANRCWNKYVAR